MDSKMHWRRAAVIGLAALAVGCAPDTGEPDGAPQGRAGGAAPPRAQSEQPSAAQRDTGARPPTTAPNPAGPGAAAAPPAAPPRLVARADISPVGDSTVRGTVELRAASADGTGPLTIAVALMGLAAGPHGFHVHEGGDCTAPGEHLNPQGSPHGPANAAAGARHLGDLGNVTADAAGMVDQTLNDSLLGGELATIVGKALVVHEGQDDLSTQPGGDSGDPVGCGIVEEAGENVLSRGPAPDRGV